MPRSLPCSAVRINSAICICKIGGHFSTPVSSLIQLSLSSVKGSGNCSPFTLRRLWYCFFFCIISSSAVSFTGTDSCSAPKANAVSSSLVPVVFKPRMRKSSFSSGTFHLLKSSYVLFSRERGQSSREKYTRQEMIDPRSPNLFTISLYQQITIIPIRSQSHAILRLTAGTPNSLISILFKTTFSQILIHSQLLVKILSRSDKEKKHFLRRLKNIGMASEKLYRNTLRGKH